MITVLYYHGAAVYVNDQFVGYLYPDTPENPMEDRLQQLLIEHAVPRQMPFSREKVDPLLMQGLSEERGDEASGQPFGSLRDQRWWLKLQASLKEQG